MNYVYSFRIWKYVYTQFEDMEVCIHIVTYSLRIYMEVCYTCHLRMWKCVVHIQFEDVDVTFVCVIQYTHTHTHIMQFEHVEMKLMGLNGDVALKRCCSVKELSGTVSMI